MSNKQERYYGTGKRKTAIARVYLQAGSGEIRVNGKSLNDYFSREVCRMVVKQPLEVLHLTAKYDITARVRGGGDSSQAGATRLGIARALVACDNAEAIVLDPEVMVTEVTEQVAAGDTVVSEVTEAVVVESEGSVVRKKLRKAGLLTRDARKVERKKVGLHKARKSTQYSKR